MVVGMNAVPTGNSGSELRIYDNGSNGVEFLLYCGNPDTYSDGIAWTGYIGPYPVGGTVRINGRGSYSLGTYTVTTNVGVGFSIPRTGTLGLGGPTAINIAVVRATAPPPPVPFPSLAESLDQITATSMRYRFQNVGDGGSPITSAAFEYWADGGPATLVGSTGTSVVSNLAPATFYNFRGRVQNAYGVSGWSIISRARTLSSVFVGKSGAFVPSPEIRAGAAGAPVAEVRVGKGGSFVPAG